MITDLLRNRPPMGMQTGARLTIKGDRQSVRSLSGVEGVKHLYVEGIKQPELDYLIAHFGPAFETLCFNNMKVADLSALDRLNKVQCLVMAGNTKATQLWDMTYNHGLRELSIIDFPQVSSLGELRFATPLECLQLGGKKTRLMRVQTLTPLINLLRLKKLSLSNIKVKEDGLLPLVSMPDLEELELPNTFPTREYAILSVRLKNTRCDHFAPYIKLPGDSDGNDIVVVGKRIPRLNSNIHAKRLQIYAKEFERLRREYM
ncbi:MAG: hypothetical protein GX133_00280 [Syntrophomonadaceae bacterium]|nr:hypothetical protein [Syntrophomonadaceae bacterium]